MEEGREILGEIVCGKSSVDHVPESLKEHNARVRLFSDSRGHQDHLRALELLKLAGCQRKSEHICVIEVNIALSFEDSSLLGRHVELCAF